MDGSGNIIRRGGFPFFATLEDDEVQYHLTCFDNRDGTYTVEYCSSRVGLYKLNVTLGDYDIYGSPFEVDIVPGPAHFSTSRCFGKGVEMAFFDQINDVEIVAFDAFGNRCVEGGASLVIDIQVWWIEG